MPLLLSLRRALSSRSSAVVRRKIPICLFCSLTKQHAPPSFELLRLGRKYSSSGGSHESTEAAAAANLSSDPRRDLATALLDLQAQAPNYVNLARLQLALRNLSQPPGHESIRVAFLGLRRGFGLSADSDSRVTAKRLLRFVLADPLNKAEKWESQLEEHDLSQPLIVRVGAVKSSEELGGERIEVATGHSIPEIKVSSHSLNEANLEILVTLADSLVTAEYGDDALAIEDSILAPTVEVAVAPRGTLTSVATPVHMALLVGDGVLGAATVLSTPIMEGSDTISAAVNFKQLGAEDLSGCPLTRINVDGAGEGLGLFREDVGNAMRYQALWSESNLGRISEWLTTSILPNEAATTKTPVRNLIQSLLQNASAKIQAEEGRGLSQALERNITPHAAARLNHALSEWSQNAHEELQQRLEAAFTSRSWRKLGWWKLFWRADDVGMLSSEMLARRFLPDAEQNIIYLAGRVQEAGTTEGHINHPLYSAPSTTTSTAVVTRSEIKWPTHISFTKRYLQDKTVPALQALAQKLVLQSAGGVTLTTALAVLTYLSAVGAYESGAIAALGLVWSLGRLQRKWEAARDFWEGEVREEGRKAIRATEASIAEVLDRSSKSQGDQVERLEELRRAQEIIQRAQEALQRL